MTEMRETSYDNYMSLRHEKLVRLVTLLRGSETLQNEFRLDPSGVAQAQGLGLTSDETDQVGELLWERFEDEMEPDWDHTTFLGNGGSNSGCADCSTGGSNSGCRP